MDRLMLAGIRYSKKALSVTGFIVLLFFLFSCSENNNTAKEQDDYLVAAYIWPSCHNDERLGQDILWPEGIGEWEMIKKGNPRFEGHYQPKLPLWGYEMDDDPEVMERWIDLAADHGVDIFIFDWYWYDDGPFLESSLNNGFLKAKNNDRMDFYVMWANHDVLQNYWNYHRYGDDNSLLWDGAVDLENFKIIVKRVIDQYFGQPNYFRIDDEPVFSIFRLEEFIDGVGGEQQAVEALDYFREEVKKAGYPGLHLQVVYQNHVRYGINKTVEKFGINSITQYNWGGPRGEEFLKYGTQAWNRIEAWSDTLSIPFFPNVTIGWDDTPRYADKGKKDVIHLNNTPESFAAYVQKAKEYCDEHPDQPPVITINAWNEWIEGAYLLPDMKYGYSYIEALDKALNGVYDKYAKKRD
jgi:hypothetical protein